MVKVDVDFAWEEKIQDVLKSIRKHRGKIIDFDPEGPGGGNPNILLGFETKKQALEFLNERYPDDTVAFNKSRLWESEATAPASPSEH
jgi:hypothetical protein